MTDWECSIATCGLQVAIVAAITLGLLGRSRRHSAVDRLMLCRWAYAGLVVLCVEAVIRPLAAEWPTWSGVVSQISLHSGRRVESDTADEMTSEAPNGLLVSWPHLQSSGRRLWSVIGSRTAPSVWPRWRPCFLIPLAGLVLLAALRFSFSVWWLSRWWKFSGPIDDEQLAAEMASLLQHYGLRGPVVLRSTSALTQAAVIGWWRPVLLFPDHWQTWSAPERRLVLAHELAHIQQGDFLWRLLAEAVLVVQAYQPLMYWLHGRLILEQELAADRAAAGLCGGPAAYLRTLSTLALRGDIRSERTTLAPVLTGLLLRRIEMLQTKDGRTVSTTQLWNWLISGGLAAAVALVAGLQLPAVADDPAVSKEDRPAEVVAVDRSPLPSNVFNRKIEAPLLVPPAASGLLELHLHEFVQSSAGKLFTPEVRREWLEELTDGMDEMIGRTGHHLIDMLRNGIEQDQVESIASDLRPIFEYRPDAPEGERHSVAFSASTIRFRMKTDHDWTDERPVAATDLPQYRGIPYLSIPLLPPGQPEDSPPDLKNHAPSTEQAAARSRLQMLAAYPDPRTLMVVFGQDELPKVFPETPATYSEDLNRLRQSVAGGVLTLVLPSKAFDSKRIANSDDPNDADFARLVSHCETVALGIDIAADNRLAIRLRCHCQDVAQSKVAEEALQSLLRKGRESLAQTTIVKTSGGEERNVDGGVTFLRELFQNVKSQRAVQPDGSVDLVYESNGSRWFEIQ